ncbi:MAG: thiamine-phosphate kinase [Ornithinimicrobium sp.]
MSHPSEPTLSDLGEDGVLRHLFSRLAEIPDPSPELLVGPGDDTAYLQVGRATLATTDVMVAGRDWLDEWSSPADVGVKLVNQNLADLAAMAGVGSALLLTLVAPPSLPATWALGFIDGVVLAASAAGVSIAGGDLSSSLREVSVSATALGHVGPGVADPVLRSGAAVGDLVAVSDELGRSAAGLEVLRRSAQDWFPPQQYGQRCASWVGYHTRPWPDLAQGPRAGRAGATSMLDISDGLLRDGGRIASASTVTLDVDSARLEVWMHPIAEVLGPEMARACVHGGGEEHTLLATFKPGTIPSGWSEIGRVLTAHESNGVLVDGQAAPAEGWDHFSGASH